MYNWVWSTTPYPRIVSFYGLGVCVLQLIGFCFPHICEDLQQSP